MVVHVSVWNKSFEKFHMTCFQNDVSILFNSCMNTPIEGYVPYRGVLTCIQLYRNELAHLYSAIYVFIPCTTYLEQCKNIVPWLYTFGSGKGFLKNGICLYVFR